MKQHRPIAAAFWLPPLIVPVLVGGLLSPHLADDAKIVLFAMMASLGFTYLAAAALGIPAFRYFRSKRAPKTWWATAFGIVAGAFTMLIGLIILLSAPMDGSLSQTPRVEYLFSDASKELLDAGAVLGAIIATVSWRMLKNHPLLQKFL